MIPGAAPTLPETLNIRYYWQVLLERRWLFITAFISVFVLCLIYLFKAPRIYQSTATIQIDRESENVASIRDASSSETREQDYLQTQYKNLQSRELIQKVIEQLMLSQDPRYIKAPDKPKAVMADITIAPIRLTRLVEIKVEHTKPKQAKDIANTLAGLFIERDYDWKRGQADDAVKSMAVEVEHQRQMVDQAEQDLQKYREKIQNVSVEATENIILQGLRLATERLAASQAQATITRKLSEEVTDMLNRGVPKEEISQVAASPIVQQLKYQLNVQLSEIAALTNRYREKYPLMLEKRHTIAALQEAIDMESTRLINSIHNDAKIMQVTMDSMQELVNSWENKQLGLGAKRMKYEELRQKALVIKDLSKKVQESANEAVVVRNNKVKNMRIRDDAYEALDYVKPKIPLTLVLGVLGGFAVGMALALFANYLDDSIKSQEDVEIHLRQNFLGYVPNIKTNSVIERDLQAHLQPQSTAAEGFRTIRAAISLMPKSEQFRILVVTSTIPSEGKSLLASNLAIVTAQTGLRTLLVDGDMRRPSVHKAFQLHSPNGLSAYLMGTVDTLEEITHDTEVPNMDVICAGAIPSNPSELAGSKRMRQFLQEVGKRYDRVFLDCPPVSAVSDPLVIAAQADGAIFVTKFNKIRREHARKSIQRLEDAGVRILGVALNDIDFEGKDSYYYSYYYYQNRYYSSHYKSTPTAKSDKKIEPAEKA